MDICIYPFIYTHTHTQQSLCCTPETVITQHCKWITLQFKKQKRWLGMLTQLWENHFIILGLDFFIFKKQRGRKGWPGWPLRSQSDSFSFSRVFQKTGLHRLSKTLNNLLVANTITITNIIPILQKRKQRITVTFPRLEMPSAVFPKLCS